MEISLSHDIVPLHLRAREKSPCQWRWHPGPKNSWPMKTFDVVSRNSVPNQKYSMTVARRGLAKEKAKNNYLFSGTRWGKTWEETSVWRFLLAITIILSHRIIQKTKDLMCHDKNKILTHHPLTILRNGCMGKPVLFSLISVRSNAIV